MSGDNSVYPAHCPAHWPQTIHLTDPTECNPTHAEETVRLLISYCSHPANLKHILFKEYAVKHLVLTQAVNLIQNEKYNICYLLKVTK